MFRQYGDEDVEFNTVCKSLQKFHFDFETSEDITLHALSISLKLKNVATLTSCSFHVTANLPTSSSVIRPIKG